MRSSFRTAASVRLADPDPFIAVLLDHLETHAEIERLPDGATIRSPYGSVRLRRMPWGLKVDAVSASAEALATVKSFIADHVFEFAAEARVDWSGHGAGDAVPSHFQEIVVEAVFDVTPRMRRIVFRCDNVAALAAAEHHHIRLLVPPEGRAPRWPGLSDDGRITWPQGEDALASRVYTIRSTDGEAGTFAVDFVLHHDAAAGPGVAFALRAEPGSCAGLLGPGGGGVPGGRSLLLLGDETALPAIARMIETADPQTHITAIVEIEDDAERAYLCPRPGLDIRWICRHGSRTGDPSPLLRALDSRLAASDEEPVVWAGCEHAVAVELRKHLAGVDRVPGRPQVTAYWKRQI
ncbi:UNVERIFIED_ORG: siderophore-interacting protein (plasmid) [Roseateles sp. XES5]|nr:siderophore-interacting protein [Roseateles sp. XES5]